VRVRVDTDICTGHARCNAVAPDIYHLDDAGYCLIPVADVAQHLQTLAQDGADVCPERAIEITA
jgi:ferredoxin